MGNLGKTYGKYGKSMENIGNGPSMENMGNLWKTLEIFGKCGTSMESMDNL